MQVVSLAWLYYLLSSGGDRDERSQLNSARLTAACGALVAFGLPAFMVLVGYDFVLPKSSLGWVLGLMLLTALVLGCLYVALLLSIRRRWKALGFPLMSPVCLAALVSALLSLLIIAWFIDMPPFLTVVVALIVITANAVIGVVLLRQPRRAMIETINLEWLRTIASSQISAALGTALAILLPMMTSIGVTISMFTIVVKPTEALTSYVSAEVNLPDAILVGMVRSAYLTQGRAFLVSFMVVGALIGLTIVVIGGSHYLIKKRIVTK